MNFSSSRIAGLIADALRLGSIKPDKQAAGLSWNDNGRMVTIELLGQDEPENIEVLAHWLAPEAQLDRGEVLAELNQWQLEHPYPRLSITPADDPQIVYAQLVAPVSESTTVDQVAHHIATATATAHEVFDHLDQHLAERAPARQRPERDLEPGLGSPGTPLVTEARLHAVAQGQWSHLEIVEGTLGGWWDPDHYFEFGVLADGSVSVFGYWQRDLPLARVDEALEFINSHHSEWVHPRAVVDDQDDEVPDAASVNTDLNLSWSHGVSDADLLTHLQHGVFSALDFFEALSEAFPDAPQSE